jgi:hypothetical protein
MFPQEHPSFYMLFNKFRSTDRESVLKGDSPLFADHVLLVMRSLGKVLARQYDPEKVEEFLHQLGNTHRQAGVGQDTLAQVHGHRIIFCMLCVCHRS